MPRSLQDVIDHADELARRFETFETDSPGHDATELRALADAVVGVGRAESTVADAVAAARRAGHTWSAIAIMLGVSTQAAQRRYSPTVEQ